MFIIAGLGNPGGEYAGTVHNIGFDVVTNLSDKYDISVTKNGFKSKAGQGFIENEKVLLLKPQTYMNLSGEAIIEAVNFYKIDVSHQLIVIQDDIDLNPGIIRIKRKGTAGSHNGLKNIISHVGNEFIRVKVGVGDKPEGWDLKDYVLSRFDREMEPLIRESIKKAGEAVVSVMKEGVDAAMNKYNGLKTGD